MERHIQKMMELSLSEEELLLLERQHKQLNIIIEQLRDIQATHYKNIVLTKRRLQLKGAAGKIVSAIQGQSTDTVTGNDMACLINPIGNGDLFRNSLSVRLAT